MKDEKKRAYLELCDYLRDVADGRIEEPEDACIVKAVTIDRENIMMAVIADIKVKYV